MSQYLDTASQLINRQIDGIITHQEQAQLAALLKSRDDVIDLYLHLMAVHGQLTWGGSANIPAVRSASARIVVQPTSDAKRTQLIVALTSAVILLLLTSSPFLWNRITSPVANGVARPTKNNEESPIRHMATENSSRKSPHNLLPPLELDSLNPRPDSSSRRSSDAFVFGPPTELARPRFSTGFSDRTVTQFIDRAIATTLQDNEVEPSPYAPGKEFARRAWLTIAGRIPAVGELPVSEPVPGSVSRMALINRLIESSERHHRLADVWTRLLVGRSLRPGIDRAALHQFLLTAFTENRSWMTVVRELISAEGRSDRNAATNFLLAHLDNRATPATAVTARLFLGQQLQCVQCHNHPFASEIHQREYWAFNAFFQHTERRPVPQLTDDVADRRPVVLTDGVAAGMTFFETRNGRHEAVLPRYAGRTLTAAGTTARRSALAQYLADDPEHQVARAMVNRLWADFFGVGFTNPVDDMGPHVIVSHPELLEGLTEAFVASDYDLTRLQSWIASSSAWQRSSRATDQNVWDNPSAGSTPLF